jgi:hypothetical protein
VIASKPEGKAIAESLDEAAPQQTSGVARPEKPADLADSPPPPVAHDRAVTVATKPLYASSAALSVQSPPIPPAQQDLLIKRSEALLKLREVASARLLLERAVANGNVKAAYLLAQTYDPRVLEAWQVRGIRGDLEKARDLYERARPLSSQPRLEVRSR